MTDTIPELFKGLIALEEASFPKKCATCGKVYNNAEDYCSQTERVMGSEGLKFVDCEFDGRLLEVFRNCTCGSTLLECFQDRRQNEARRELFGQLMLTLVEQGYDRDQARHELLQFMHGKPCEIRRFFNDSVKLQGGLELLQNKEDGS